MTTHLGWPVVTAENCFDVITRECGIVPWRQVGAPVPIADYLATASDDEREEHRKFGPKDFAVRFENPVSKQPFNGFRSVFKAYSLVIALIDGMIPVTAEWKHGNAKITIVPVCGVPGKQEQGLSLLHAMVKTGYREFFEETGIELESLKLLSPQEGWWSEVRKGEMRCFPFLGKVKEPVVKGPSKLDDSEVLAMVLFPIAEWLKLLESPVLWDEYPDFGLESCAPAATYAALRDMGRLQLS